MPDARTPRKPVERGLNLIVWSRPHASKACGARGGGRACEQGV